MRILSTFLLVGFCMFASSASASNGDTIKVQTFTFGSPQDSVFLFPPATEQFEKILMRYTLKCNPAQNPACGEWDYLTYTYLFKDGIRYELARYITPYGIGLSMGDGWTWTFDVSDYRTLLADSVHLKAGNWQELLNMEFWMIKGTPPRDIIGIENLWNGNFNYGVDNDPIENNLTAKTVQVPANAKGARIKSRITGHGFGGNENCAEFCAKNHSFTVNSTKRFEKLVWRDDCAYNPLYPQGGTWVYQRANWCPGAEVWTYDFELTPYVVSGQTVSLDHNVEAYQWNGAGSTPYYAIEDQVVFYGEPNFNLDAAIVDVIAPSDNQMYERMNPVCSQPVVRIRNTGATPLTSLVFHYGMGAGNATYNWSGNLAFMEETTVELGAFQWTESGIFEVTIDQPNGGSDEYAHNNTFRTRTAVPEILPNTIMIEVRTNNNPEETSYTLTDIAGNTILSRSGLAANTYYRDTLTLGTGCYEFRLKDSGEDGLKWWANTAQGQGLVRLKRETGAGLKNFETDFGAELYFPFTVGNLVVVQEKGLVDKTEFKVFPNPSNGLVHINLDFPQKRSGTVEIRDIGGKQVYNYDFQNSFSEGIDAELSHLSGGVYIVIVNTGTEMYTQKLVIGR